MTWAKFAILAVLLAIIALLAVGNARLKAQLERERAIYAAQREQAAKAQLEASEAYRAKEQAWAASAAAIQSEGEARNAQIQKRAADLDRTVGGLRGSLNTALNTLRSSAASSPAIAANCTNAIESAGMYADMLGSLAERGAKVARAADEAFTASQACVAAYKLN